MIELCIAFGAGAIGLILAAFLVWQRQPGWATPVLAALLAAGSVGLFAGAYQHRDGQNRSGLVLLWLAAVLELVAAIWSALSPLLVGVALLALLAAVLGTWRASQGAE